MKRPLKSGMAAVFPIVLGYTAIGFAFGILAQKVGMSPINTLLMSLIVYAGSSQLIAVGLVADGASGLSIIATTFIVNLRHMLMSAAISRYLKLWPKSALAVFAYQLTDETFAVHAKRFADCQPDRVEALTVNMAAQSSWVLGTWLGIMVGQLVTSAHPLALDYALPAMFIALLVLQVKDGLQILVAAISGVLSVWFFLIGMERWNVMMAAIAGATLGVVFEEWIKRRSFS